jgi:hypothetical protein
MATSSSQAEATALLSSGNDAAKRGDVATAVSHYSKAIGASIPAAFQPAFLEHVKNFTSRCASVRYIDAQQWTEPMIS